MSIQDNQRLSRNRLGLAAIFALAALCAPVSVQAGDKDKDKEYGAKKHSEKYEGKKHAGHARHAEHAHGDLFKDVLFGKVDLYEGQKEEIERLFHEARSAGKEKHRNIAKLKMRLKKAQKAEDPDHGKLARIHSALAEAEERRYDRKKIMREVTSKLTEEQKSTLKKHMKHAIKKRASAKREAHGGKHRHMRHHEKAKGDHRGRPCCQ